MKIKRFDESNSGNMSIPPVPPVIVELNISKNLVRSIIGYATESGLDMDDLTLEMKQNFVSLYIKTYIENDALEVLATNLYDTFEDYIDEWKVSLERAYDKITK